LAQDTKIGAASNDAAAIKILGEVSNYFYALPHAARLEDQQSENRIYDDRWLLHKAVTLCIESKME
jgi:hypothetical protein